MSATKDNFTQKPRIITTTTIPVYRPFSRTTQVPVNWYQNTTTVDFIGARMIEMVATTADTRRAKLQLNRHHQQQTNTNFFTGRMTQPTVSENQRE